MREDLLVYGASIAMLAIGWWILSMLMSVHAF